VLVAIAGNFLNVWNQTEFPQKPTLLLFQRTLFHWNFLLREINAFASAGGCSPSNRAYDTSSTPCFITRAGADNQRQP
jgi:hypothetical protein